MPTPESESAFTKLVEARTNLNEITKKLGEAHARFNTICGNLAERKRYIELQKQWDAAYSKFKTMTEEFAAIVDKIERPMPK